jgi:hypothetical protein
MYFSIEYIPDQVGDENQVLRLARLTDTCRLATSDPGAISTLHEHCRFRAHCLTGASGE